MERIKRYISVFMTLCLIIGCVAFSAPEKAQASLDTTDGRVDVYNLENDYKDGKYRIWEQVVYTKQSYAKGNGYGLKVSDQYVSNSAGKKVATWNDWTILTEGGKKNFYYAVAFSKLPSDTYTLHFTITSNYNSKAARYTRKITHSAGKVAYKSSKYEYNTNGEVYLKIVFSIEQMKGYAPTFEIFNSKGKKIYSRTNNSKVNYTDCAYSFKWYFKDNNGDPVPVGTYTFKVTCNGKTCSKNLTIK